MRSGSEQEGAPGVRLTRRQLLQAGAVVGLGAGLTGSGLLAAGCGSSGSGTSASPAATSGTVKRGGIFTFATDQLFPKDGLDPLKNIDDGQDALEGMLREGLVTYDFKFNPRAASGAELGRQPRAHGVHVPSAAQRHLARRHAVHGQRRRLVDRADHVARRRVGHDAASRLRASKRTAWSSSTTSRSSSSSSAPTRCCCWRCPTSSATSSRRTARSPTTRRGSGPAPSSSSSTTRASPSRSTSTQATGCRATRSSTPCAASRTPRSRPSCSPSLPARRA